MEDIALASETVHWGSISSPVKPKNVLNSRCITPKRVTSQWGPSQHYCASAPQFLSKYVAAEATVDILSPI